MDKSDEKEKVVEKGNVYENVFLNKILLNILIKLSNSKIEK